MRNLPGSKTFSITKTDSAAFSASETCDSDQRIFITDVAASSKQKGVDVILYESDDGGDTKIYQQSIGDGKNMNQSFQTPLVVSSGKYLKASVTEVSSEARVNVSGYKA